MITGQLSAKKNTVLRLNLELYRKLYLIRNAEQKIREHYPENEMKTPVHLSIGKEAIEVGVCHALESRDRIFGTYRSHGIYLARTGETDAFFAELYGRRTGLVRGKVGSMHLCAPEHGLMVTSAIVGSAIPVAVGAAFASKVRSDGSIVAVFFGDGATEEGVFWESLNVASLMQLPVLFVCEDNDLAVFTPPECRRGYDCIRKVVSQYNCTVLGLDTTDAETVYRTACDAVQAIRRGGGPCFLHLKYYRYLEHVGVEEDFDAGYRTREEFSRWYEKDPITLQRTKLCRLGAREEDLLKLEEEIDRQITRSIALAKESPLADTCELYRDVL